ncbi:hypothetical protein BVC71_03530 [Marivivens niveibacter]|uniref:DUF2155 domain-containing protein n=1 Tax=Marivivens niveibacter TaxID=1930667 RepID=A0A251X2D4_9RHOB|nr:DUF2155 domain-containing protein [Marivivens niveibacter]OUD10575.1 hypothetical protein BVC71_03530 [Marivivens niveibacter]
MIRAIAFVAAMLATPAFAQDAANANGADLRLLDKISGQVTTLNLSVGDRATVGHLQVVLNECRYPVDNPSGDAFAELTAYYNNQADPVFDGWMIASAPALSAMEHPRYDVWVVRCITS